MRRTFILVTVVALIMTQAWLLGCRTQSAQSQYMSDDYMDYGEFNNFEDWFAQLLTETKDPDYDQRTDQTASARYPWCDALDSYYLADSIWQYSDSTQAFYTMSPDP